MKTSTVHRLISSLLIPTVTMIAACTNVEAPITDAGGNIAAVSGGVPVDDSVYPGAGYVLFEHPDEPFIYFCSATLVGDRVVLTAAHCIYPDEYPLDDPRTTAVFGIGSDWTDPVDEIPIVRHEVHGRYVEGSDNLADYQYDIALLELEFHPDINTIPLDTMALGVEDVGSTLYSYSYGSRNVLANLTRPDGDDFGVKRKGTFKLEELQPDGLNFLTVEWARGESDSLCVGDSGGGVFREQDGVLSMVALTSVLQGSSCRTGTGNAPLVVPLLNWIEDWAGGRPLDLY